MTKATKNPKEDARFSVKETFDKVRDDVTKRIDEFNNKYVKENVKTSKKFFNKQYKKVNKLVEKQVKTTKESIDEYRSSVNDYIESWKKFAKNLPIKNTIEKKFNEGINKIPTLMNLPGKKEIEKLIADLETLNNKVDSLARKA